MALGTEKYSACSVPVEGQQKINILSVLFFLQIIGMSKTELETTEQEGSPVQPMQVSFPRHRARWISQRLQNNESNTEKEQS